MAAKKTRSITWVASTYVLTAGFAMPLIAVLIGSLVLSQKTLPPFSEFLILLVIQAVGYIAGIFYSLSYIQKVTVIEKPLACIKPSIIWFFALATLGFIVTLVRTIQENQISPALAISCLIAYYAAVSLIFIRLTKMSFSRMQPQTAEDQKDKQL